MLVACHQALPVLVMDIDDAPIKSGISRRDDRGTAPITRIDVLTVD